MQSFDGKTYDHQRDGVRLNSQLQRVKNAMQDGVSRTLEELSRVTGDPQASVSARLRDLRKERFGSHQIERKYVSAGVFEYRLIDPKWELQYEALA